MSVNNSSKFVGAIFIFSDFFLLMSDDGTNPKGRYSEKSKKSIRSIGSGYAEIAANAAITLIIVACSLLNRQILAQAEAFEKEGGFTERLYQRRQSRRRG